jgi:hypothetical protein
MARIVVGSPNLTQPLLLYPGLTGYVRTTKAELKILEHKN